MTIPDSHRVSIYFTADLAPQIPGNLSVTERLAFAVKSFVDFNRSEVARGASLAELVSSALKLRKYFDSSELDLDDAHLTREVSLFGLYYDVLVFRSTDMSPSGDFRISSFRESPRGRMFALIHDYVTSPEWRAKRAAADEFVHWLAGHNIAPDRSLPTPRRTPGRTLTYEDFSRGSPDWANFILDGVLSRTEEDPFILTEVTTLLNRCMKLYYSQSNLESIVSVWFHETIEFDRDILERPESSPLTQLIKFFRISPHPSSHFLIRAYLDQDEESQLPAWTAIPGDSDLTIRLAGLITPDNYHEVVHVLNSNKPRMCYFGQLGIGGTDFPADAILESQKNLDPKDILKYSIYFQIFRSDAHKAVWLYQQLEEADESILIDMLQLLVVPNMRAGSLNVNADSVIALIDPSTTNQTLRDMERVLIVHKLSPELANNSISRDELIPRIASHILKTGDGLDVACRLGVGPAVSALVIDDLLTHCFDRDIDPFISVVDAKKLQSMVLFHVGNRLSVVTQHLSEDTSRFHGIVSQLIGDTILPTQSGDSRCAIEEWLFSDDPTVTCGEILRGCTALLHINSALDNETIRLESVCRNLLSLFS